MIIATVMLWLNQHGNLRSQEHLDRYEAGKTRLHAERTAASSGAGTDSAVVPATLHRRPASLAIVAPDLTAQLEAVRAAYLRERDFRLKQVGVEAAHQTGCATASASRRQPLAHRGGNLVAICDTRGEPSVTQVICVASRVGFVELTCCCPAAGACACQAAAWREFPGRLRAAHHGASRPKSPSLCPSTACTDGRCSQPASLYKLPSCG